MGDSGPAHDVGTFSSHADDLCLGEILPVIHSRDSPATWSTSIHRIRLQQQLPGEYTDGTI